MALAKSSLELLLVEEFPDFLGRAIANLQLTQADPLRAKIPSSFHVISI